MSSDEKSNEETLEVKDLQPYSKQVNTTVKVTSKGEEREVVSRSDGSSHRVTEFLIGDSTGSIYLTMWDDNIDKLEEGKNITIKNGYVSLFKGSMRLNIGRYGSFEDSEEGPAEVNTDNNMSDKQFEQERRSFRPRDSGYSRGRGGGSGYRRRSY
jgi:replication factor A1